MEIHFYVMNYASIEVYHQDSNASSDTSFGRGYIPMGLGLAGPACSP